MRVTEVRIKLNVIDDKIDKRLLAFASIVLDHEFFVGDLKIVKTPKGLLISMPSRKISDHCHQCKTKNAVTSRFCTQCGCKLKENRIKYDIDGRLEIYADIAHPLNFECRKMIDTAVIGAYYKELELAKQPGYVSRYDEPNRDNKSFSKVL